MSNLESCLSVINFEKFGETKGKVFTADNFAKDWDSIFVVPSDLFDGIVNDHAFHKVNRKALVLDMKKPRMAYVIATPENPVYVPATRFEKTSEGKYTPKGFLIFSLDISIMIPEFVFFLCRQGIWEKLLKSRDYSPCFGDPYQPSMEECFLSYYGDISEFYFRYEIPSLSQQRDRITGFKEEDWRKAL